MRITAALLGLHSSLVNQLVGGIGNITPVVLKKKIGKAAPCVFWGSSHWYLWDVPYETNVEMDSYRLSLRGLDTSYNTAGQNSCS